METKKMVLIVVLIIILCAVVGAIFVTLTNAVDYERIELTPDGTSIEIPKQEANYVGEINETGCKQWTFKQGTLMSFNSEEAIDARGIYGLGGALGIKAIEDSILNHFEKREEIDGFSVYSIDGEKFGVQGRGMLYCIITGNDDTHDNIIIAADNKDVVLHMAKSIQYKTSNSTSNSTGTNSGSSSSSGSNSANTQKTNDNNNKNKYSEEDLARANEAGYYDGYSDGYSDSYEDSYSYSSSSQSSSSSGSSSSSVGRPVEVVDGNLE